ncbi:MAG: M20/M25/M40 family metallo-hydrolase [Bacillota bacterium]|nr:M20/M25/M40 family metallo-hydrolase [Bacillota bacterium]
MPISEAPQPGTAGWPDERLKLRLKELLVQLTAIPGVSGFEAPVARYMADRLRGCSDRLAVDAMGNLFATRHGGRPGPAIMVAAHSDEIGLIVKSIEKSGFVRFDKIGGMLDPLLIGRMVTIRGHLGIIGVKAGHLQTSKERTEVKPYTDLFIDVGEQSAEGVAALGIRVGDPIEQRSDLTFFADGDRFAGKAVDDRLGCAVLAALFESLAGEEFAGTLVGVVTVQEEVGLRGATVAAHRVNPDLAIALDTMPCGDTPDVDYARELPVGIGRGPVLQVMSGGTGGKGILVNPGVRRLLEDTARAAGVEYQVTTFTGGNTDATAMHLVRDGIPAGVITLARRYSHSPVEMGDINDAMGAWRILRGLVKTSEQVGGYLHADIGVPTC